MRGTINWFWFAVFVAGVAALVSFVVRLIPPAHKDRRAAHDENEAAADTYAWGRHIPGFSGFWAAIEGALSWKSDDGHGSPADGASHEHGNDGPGDSE